MKPSKPTVSSVKPPSPPSPKSDSAGLAEFQRRVAAAVMQPLTPGGRMRRGADDAVALVKPNDRLNASERLEIYNRQYWFRLLDCLYEDYPGLRAVLGERAFQRLSCAYLARHPSESPLLRNLGRMLADFLAVEPAFAGRHHTLAHEMALLEWAQVVAFDEVGHPPFSLQRLIGRDPDAIFLRLQPYATLLDLDFPVDEVVVRLLRQDSRMRSGASNAVESPIRPRRHRIAARVRPQPVKLLVHRHENSVYFKRLTAPQFHLLDSLDRGTSLAAACAELAASPAEIRGWFETWAALGLLA